YARLAGDGPRQQRLARSRWADQQHPLGHLAAQPLEALRVTEEVDYLLQLELRLLHPGHVLECGLGTAGSLHPGPAPTEGEDPLGRLPAAAQDPDPEADQQQEGQEVISRLPSPPLSCLYSYLTWYWSSRG